ncbi:CATRA system-associated protein [Herbidospora yilanensis]|uniref:CATRA system-associated protein n=1 Tax=Herbidospora yilanensis TaxID=354426 RepID=UPI000782B7A3|nr:CATRA system-associated protein [Herbidospora yilanensis]
MTDAHDDLLDLVTDIAQWRVPPGHWETIGGLLDLAAASLDEPAALRLVLEELENAGQGRITKIGSPPIVPPPPPVRERLNQLVHELSGPKK